MHVYLNVHNLLDQDIKHGGLLTQKDIYMAVLIPYGDILFTKLRIVLGTIVVLILVALWITAIYSVIIRKITISIEQLSEFAQDISQGNLDKLVSIPNASTEIFMLVEGFNHMVRSLRRASDDIMAEKNRLEAIITCIPDGVILTDLDNRLIRANNQAERMFNFSLKAFAASRK